MSSSSKRDLRKRVYALVTLGMVCVVGLVAMGSMLARGHDVMNQKVYKYPAKTLVALTKAQSRFRRKDLDRDGQADFAASLAELESAGTITGKLADGEVGGYRYAVISADQTTYTITATPAAVTTSSVFYFVDQSRIIRAQAGAPANAESQVFWSPYKAGWGR